MARRVLITGATGFIGGAIARHLLLQGLVQPGDVDVRVLVRDPQAPAASALAALGAELVRGDLLDAGSLQEACTACDWVVHAATDTVMNDRARAWEVGVDGTRRMAEAAARAGVRRFVFLSSFAVYGGVSGEATESATLMPYGDLYGDTKIAAEAALQQATAESALPELTILRFPSVYGSASTLWTIKPLEAARKNKLVLPGGGRFAFPYLHIDSLVSAVTRALLAERVGVYNVFDGVTTFADFMGRYAAMVGTRPRVVPLAPLFVLAWLLSLTGRFFPLNRRSVKAMAKPMGNKPFLPEKCRSELNWEPLLTLDQGMAQIHASLTTTHA